MEHQGHRERMRNRFMETGLEGFAAHEVLELLLYYAIPRRDVNPLAHELINTFGSFRGVLEATPQQLMQVKGVTERTAALLGLMLPMFRRYTADLSQSRTVIANRLDAQRYCISLLAGRRNEHFYIIGLDASSTVVGAPMICSGDISEVPAYPRQIVQAALALNAHSVVMCHNHPGGIARPSQQDIETTEQLIDALSAIGIVVLDHLIIVGNNCYSMSLQGDLAFATSPDPAMAAERRPIRRK